MYIDSTKVSYNDKICTLYSFFRKIKRDGNIAKQPTLIQFIWYAYMNIYVFGKLFSFFQNEIYGPYQYKSAKGN